MFRLFLVFLALILLSASASAQVQTSGSGMSMGFTASIAKPEGSAPAYLVSSQCWYNTISTDPDPIATPSLNLESGVAYSWNDGSKRTVIEMAGPMQYSSDKSGYLWSFDLSGDAYRAFGSNGIVFLQTRDGHYLTTGQKPPYLIGASQITVLDGAGLPVAGADVKLINSVTGEYSESTTGSSGQLTFGQPAYSTPNAPYAPGLTSDPYHFKVTSQNMADAVAGDQLGGSYAGQNFAVKMSASSSSVSPVATTSGSGGGSGGSGGGSGTCTAQTVAMSPSDGGGGAGISGWSDGAFPASVQPAFLHSNSWKETVTVPVAGSYVITGDCPTAANIGTITLSVGSTVGTPVSCASSSPAANLAANFGTFTLAAGANVVNFTLVGQYGAVKTLYLTPDASCGAGSGSGSGSVFDLSSFFQKLADFFTLQQADIDALHAIGKKFSSYGVLGAITGIYQQYQDAFGATNTSMNPDCADPHYWTIQFNDASLKNVTSAGGPYSTPAAPAGYDPNRAYQAPTNPAPIYANILPGSVDLGIYSSYILTGRRLALVAFWCITGIVLVRRFTPSMRI